MADTDTYRVKPGKKLNLSKWPTEDKGRFESKEEGEAATAELLTELQERQGLLYADGRRAVLVVLQAMDAGGKDGAIRTVFSGVNPQGCMVHSFKKPSDEELKHDFLWRVHRRCPEKGMIGIFNRSHYESVLVERVAGLVSEKVWKKRYDHIADFEQMLSEEGTVVIKFFLHISKEEQKKRLEERLADPSKNWKFAPSDVDARKQWDAYQEAYEDAMSRTSTEECPWYVVPADKKWYRNFVLADVLVRKIKELKLSYPPAAEGISNMKVK